MSTINPHKEKKKKVLAIDMDNVLCQYTNSFLNWYNKEYKTIYKLSDMKTFTLWKELNESQDRLEEKIDLFSKSEEFKIIPPIEGMYEALLKLCQYFTLI